jgi:hypothetical protein
MAENAVSVPAYDSGTGVVAPVEGGTVIVEIRDGTVEIFGDPAGLRDLARWCLALSHEQAPTGAHVHLEPGTIPLAMESMPLMLARHPRDTPERCSRQMSAFLSRSLDALGPVTRR